MIIRINPLDTFFFRDARPFEMGEEAWANSVFPPSPSVIYGALRTLYFAHKNMLNLKKEELDEETKNFKIRGIFTSIFDDILLPIPKDIVRDKETKKLHFLKRKAKPELSSAKSLEVLQAENLSEETKGFVLMNNYTNILARENIENIKVYDDILKEEPKIGIGRNKNTKTTEEGKLYRVGMQRFDTEKYKNGKIVVVYEGLELPEKYISKIGGEAKTYSYELQNIEIPENGFIEYPESIENNIFRACLISPCFFEKGWFPNWIDKDTFEGIVPNTSLKLKLLTASVGKTISLGGFDMKANNGKGYPKTMRKAVPAGSVYYFEILEGTYQDVIKNFHFQSISEYDTAKEGFGITYVGK